MKKLLVAVLLVCITWTVASTSAFAQEPMLACGELSEEDCGVLMDGMMATMGLSSVTTDGYVSILFENVPDAPVSTIPVDLFATTMSSVDPMAAMAVMELEQTVMENTEEQLPTMLEASADVYESATIVSDIELVTSEEVAQAISELSGLAIPETIAISGGVVDNLGFVNLDEIAPLIPDPAWSEALMGWHAVNIVEIIEEIAAEAEASGAMAMEATAEEELNGMVAAMVMGNSEPFRDFLTVERLDDTEMDGQAVAVFETSVDFAALLASPLFQELVMTQMEAEGDMTDAQMAELEATLQMVGFMAPVLVEGLEASTIRTVGLDDGYLHSAETYFLWDLSSLSTLAELVGASDATDFIDSTNPPLVSVEVVTNYSGYGEPVEAELPAEYLFYPTEAIIAGLEQ